MNGWNLVEDRLEKWHPRKPSPDLKRRIFGRSENDALGPIFSFREASRWLVPACGCFLLVLSSLSTRFQESNASHLAAINPSALTGEAAESNFYSRSPEHSDINSVPFKHLEYNFGARTQLSSPASYLVSHTNRLIE